MNNRRVTGRTLSRASGRAESTINQLLSGRVSPTTELLQDLAPVLQIDVADLLVIAGLPVEHDVSMPGAYRASQEIGSLVAAASWLSADQVGQLVALARGLQSGDS